jgi:hypothetical protein
VTAILLQNKTTPIYVNLDVEEKANYSANQAVVWELKNSNVRVKFIYIYSSSIFVRNRFLSVFVGSPKGMIKNSVAVANALTYGSVLPAFFGLRSAVLFLNFS